VSSVLLDTLRDQRLSIILLIINDVTIHDASFAQFYHISSAAFRNESVSYRQLLFSILCY